MRSVSSLRKALAAIVIAICAVFALSACGGGSSDAKDSSSSSSAGGDSWPRTVKDDDGHSVKLDKKPENIVSGSVTLTGSLLAIDAPVKASGATKPNTPLSDDQGFFTQWSDIAKKKDVKSLYKLDVNIEAIAAQKPDLIVVSKVGQDAAADKYDQLKDIAPVFVVDYSTEGWEDVSKKLGEVTGHEDDAKKAIDEFDKRADEVKGKIKVDNPVTGANYNPKSASGGGKGINVWTDKSAQGRLMKSLGMEITDVPEDAQGGKGLGKREDVYQVSQENLSKAMTGETVLLFNADEKKVAKYMSDPLVADTPAVKNKRVYAVGLDSFRLDYYSANNVLDSIEEQLQG